LTEIGLLRGLPIKELKLQDNAVRDLEPLRGMPLEELGLINTKVRDLEPPTATATLCESTT